MRANLVCVRSEVTHAQRAHAEAVDAQAWQRNSYVRMQSKPACVRTRRRTGRERWHVKRKRTMCTLLDVGWQTRGYLCQSAGGIINGIYSQYSNMSASKARWPSGLRRSIKEDILSTQEVTCYLRAWVRIPLLSPFFFFLFFWQVYCLGFIIHLRTSGVEMHKLDRLFRRVS